jgi:hypothetical protein
MAKRRVDFGNPQTGPIQHAALAIDLIERIQAYKDILGDTDPASIDQAIDGFCRDLNPEKEIEIWEHITRLFHNFTTAHAITGLAQRREVFRALLVISTGGEVQPSATLTRDHLAELTYNFDPNYHGTCLKF